MVYLLHFSTHQLNITSSFKLEGSRTFHRDNISEYIYCITSKCIFIKTCVQGGRDVQFRCPLLVNSQKTHGLIATALPSNEAEYTIARFLQIDIVRKLMSPKPVAK